MYTSLINAWDQKCETANKQKQQTHHNLNIFNDTRITPAKYGEGFGGNSCYEGVIEFYRKEMGQRDNYSGKPKDIWGWSIRHYIESRLYTKTIDLIISPISSALKLGRTFSTAPFWAKEKKPKKLNFWWIDYIDFKVLSQFELPYLLE